MKKEEMRAGGHRQSFTLLVDIKSAFFQLSPYAVHITFHVVTEHCPGRWDCRPEVSQATEGNSERLPFPKCPD